MNTTEIREHLKEHLPEAYVADGFDDAILGTAYRCSLGPIIAYDRARCIQILVDKEGLSLEEAEEHFSFNVEGAYVGELTPIFVTNLRNPECPDAPDGASQPPPSE